LTVYSYTLSIKGHNSAFRLLKFVYNFLSNNSPYNDLDYITGVF